MFVYTILIIFFSGTYESRCFSTSSLFKKQQLKVDEKTQDDMKVTDFGLLGNQSVVSPQYRYIYPEFLPDPKPDLRNKLRERLEREDMMKRRSVLDIPEFYVGSILSVTYSEPHAPGKVNKFVGICIQRTGCGTRASFILRNVVDHQGVEVEYQLYDPSIQSIECLR